MSLVCPHFPLIARPEWYNLYPEDKVPLPFDYAEGERPRHPFIDAMRACQVYDEAFDEKKARKAIAAYYGLVSFVDHNVGRLVKALEDNGLADETASSTRAITATISGRGAFGASQICTRSWPPCR